MVSHLVFRLVKFYLIMQPEIEEIRRGNPILPEIGLHVCALQSVCACVFLCEFREDRCQRIYGYTLKCKKAAAVF